MRQPNLSHPNRSLEGSLTSRIGDSSVKDGDELLNDRFLLMEDK